MNTGEQWIDEVREEYDKALGMKYIRKPLAYALWKVWQRHDKYDKERSDTPYTRVCLNIHSDYTYSTATVQKGFIEGLGDLVSQNDWLSFAPPKSIMIMRKCGDEPMRFIRYCFKVDNPAIAIRDKRSDEFEEFEDETNACEYVRKLLREKE